MSAALLDHLWQSTLFAAAVWLMTPLFRTNSASLRFWLWFAASVKFLVPFSILAMAGRHLLPPVAPVMGPGLVAALRPVAIPFSQQAQPLLLQVPPQLSLVGLGAAVWLLGMMAVLARWLLHSLRLRTHLREAANMPLIAPVPVKAARSSLEPGVLGIWRPVILLPEGIAESLSPTEIEAVMAHELCHLRRQDNLLAAVHMLVQALFWFHPMVWWLGGRLMEERELACDEAVVAGGIQPLAYAQGLLKVCRRYVQSPLPCAAGVSGAALEIRIGTILENRTLDDVGEAKRALLVSGAALTVMLPLFAGTMASDPVTHIANRIISVIAAQAAPPAVVMAPDTGRTAHKSGTHRRRHAAALRPVIPERIAVAPLEGIVARDANVVMSAPAVVTPRLDSQPASAGGLEAATADDFTAMVCRSPQPLPGSRLLGPRVCRSKGEWAKLRQQGKDIAADGRIVEADDGRDRWLRACIPTFVATYSNTGILCF